MNKSSQIIDRAVRKMRRTLIATSRNPRPSSRPFISGDTFRIMADHIHDDTTSFNPAEVMRGQSVFVKSDMITDFFSSTHGLIQNPYVLITHNSDSNITSTLAQHADDPKIIRWFAQNATVIHPKITPIPIGLENAHYQNHGIPSCITRLRLQPEPVRKPRILFGFSASTNPSIRNKALEHLNKSTCTDAIAGKISPFEYLRLLRQYMFVAAPEGNGHDTHRVWEAVALGVIPIVLKSPMFEHFSKIGLPVHMIERWEDVESLTEKELSRTHADIQKRCGPVGANLIAWHYWQGIVRAPEDRRDEAIVCVATGKAFREKKYEPLYKATQEAYAYRLCKPLIVINETIQPVEKRPTWQKLMMWKTPILSDMERVLLVDADIYIKRDVTDDLMDIVPRDHWGLAKNNAFDLPTLAETDLILYEQCPLENRPEFVLNCGLFVVSKTAHRDIMEYVFEHYGEQRCDEQGPFCYHLITKFPGTILPFKFNNIVGSYFEKNGYSMSTVVRMFEESGLLHFAGKGNLKIRSLVNAFDGNPLLFRIVKNKRVLVTLDGITSIIKRLKKI